MVQHFIYTMNYDENRWQMMADGLSTEKTDAFIYRRGVAILEMRPGLDYAAKYVSGMVSLVTYTSIFN